MLRRHIEALHLPTGWYDGELVACDDLGQPDFGRLQEILAKREVSDSLAYYLFDLQYAAEHDLRHVPLAERRRTLQAILATRTDMHVRFSSELKGAPSDVLEAACGTDIEGVMCKRADSLYADGRRLHVRFSSELKGAPSDVLEAACGTDIEGVMCKRADSLYADGRRSTAWRKLKCRQYADLVIGG